MAQTEVIHSKKFSSDFYSYKQINLHRDGFILHSIDYSTKSPISEIIKYDTVLTEEFRTTIILPKGYSRKNIEYNKADNTLFYYSCNKNNFYLVKLDLKTKEKQVYENVFKKITELTQSILFEGNIIAIEVQNKKIFIEKFDIENSKFETKTIEINEDVFSIDDLQLIENDQKISITVNKSIIIILDKDINKVTEFKLPNSENDFSIMESHLILNKKGEFILSGTYRNGNSGKYPDGIFLKNLNDSSKNLIVLNADDLIPIIGNKFKFKLSYISSIFEYHKDYYFVVENFEQISTGSSYNTTGTSRRFTKANLIKIDENYVLSLINSFEYFGRSDGGIVASKPIFKYSLTSQYPYFYYTNDTDFILYNPLNEKSDFFNIQKFINLSDYISFYSSDENAFHLYDKVFLTYHGCKVSYKDENKKKKEEINHYLNLIKIK